jgi:hypothetical protein
MVEAVNARSVSGTAVFVLSWLLLAGVLGQFFLAGAGAFGATSFDAHAGLGVLLVLVALLLLVLALVAGSLRKPALLLFAVLVVQMILGGLGRDQVAWIGAFHALNAVAVLALSYALARAARGAHVGVPGDRATPSRKESHVPDSVVS